MKISLCLVLALSCAAPAFAIVTVTSPTNGAELVSPFALVATASPCSLQTITAMGYSLDSSSSTTTVKSTSINLQVNAPLGPHVLHVKSWGSMGAVCTTNVNISIVPDPVSSVPSTATVVSNIQVLTNWKAENDTATGNGTSTGTMKLVSAPSLSGVARSFYTTYTNAAGERYHVSYGADLLATNFLYDGWIFIDGSIADVANLELDMNQVTTNGQTVIYGFQCDGYTRTWDYTQNAGTPQSPNDQWLHSAASCNLQTWAPNAWHHVQISYSRDNAGNVTYKSVWLDGVQQDINATVPSSFALGWGSTLLTNFQVDGLGGYGSSTLYLDSLTIYRW
jgi:hypothetical protein